MRITVTTLPDHESLDSALTDHDELLNNSDYLESFLDNLSNTMARFDFAVFLKGEFFSIFQRFLLVSLSLLNSNFKSGTFLLSFLSLEGNSFSSGQS